MDIKGAHDIVGEILENLDNTHNKLKQHKSWERDKHDIWKAIYDLAEVVDWLLYRFPS